MPAVVVSGGEGALKLAAATRRARKAARRPRGFGYSPMQHECSERSLLTTCQCECEAAHASARGLRHIVPLLANAFAAET